MGKKLKANKAQGSKLKAKGREGLRPLEGGGKNRRLKWEWERRNRELGRWNAEGGKEKKLKAQG